ncbi:hypothetical protein BYT27DRAFT_7207620, partial [Phlegmacium glaucopus]
MNSEIISAQQSSPMRFKSSTIFSYPWQTSVLEVADFATVLNETRLKVGTSPCGLPVVMLANLMQQDFSERITMLEGLISSASKGDAFSLRKFLCFEREYTHLPSNLDISALQAKTEGVIANLSTKNRATLSSLLLAYRTADVAAALEGYPERPLKFQQTRVFGDEIQLFNHLHTWPSLLTTFRHAIGLSNISVIQSGEVSSAHRHVAILRNLVAHKGASSAFVNIQLAVISLHRLLIDSEIDRTDGNASGFSHDDLEYLRIVASSSDKLEVPFRLALFISPLFLLIPKSLHKLKRRVDFFEVIETQVRQQTGKRLGNQRPPLLARVEKELYSSLFRLATQDLCFLTEIKDCMGRIPWDELNAIDASSGSSWFQPAGDAPSSLPTAEAVSSGSVSMPAPEEGDAVFSLLTTEAVSSGSVSMPAPEEGDAPSSLPTAEAVSSGSVSMPAPEEGDAPPSLPTAEAREVISSVPEQEENAAPPPLLR